MIDKLVIERYSKGSKFFHWLIALLIIAMLGYSFFLGDTPEQWKSLAYMLHKSIGLSILVLMILRLGWLFYSGKPTLPLTVPAWQRYLAHAVQYGLYFFVIVMALCGWIMSVAANRIPSFFGLFNVSLPGVGPDKQLSSLMFNTHQLIAWILIALIALHGAGALKHYFINKDNVLRRMLPWGK